MRTHDGPRRWGSGFYASTRIAATKLGRRRFREWTIAKSCSFAPRKRTAEFRHRARVALRFARDADGCAEVHQRLVEVEDMLLPRHHGLRHRPQVLLHRVRLRVAAAHEHAE